jgi:protein TonB
MPRRPSVLLFSILVHAIMLLVIASADLWRPITDWPMPREAMAFEAPRIVRIDDVQLPPQARRTTHQQSPPGPAQRTEAAPIVAPPDVAPEIERPESALRAPSGPDPLEKLGGPGGGDVPAPPAPEAVAPPRPTAPIRLHSGIKPPERLVNVPPAYPMVARVARVEGMVIIEATIDERGNVTQTRILRSIPLLDESAVAAVRQWKFSPTLLNGVPVSIVMTVTVNFKLTQ